MIESKAIFRRGTAITTSGVSQNFAMPVDSAGNIPKFIRVAATAPAYFAIVSTGAGAAAAGDILVQPADAVILKTAGLGFCAVIQQAGAGALQVSPLDDQG